MTQDALEHYREQGYAVVRGFFSRSEVKRIAAAFDRVLERGLGYPRSFRHQNVLFRLGQDANLGRVLRLVQWPSYFEPVLDEVRRDPRFLEFLSPLLGRNVKQIVNQLHWKTPGAEHSEFGFHQDIRFRRPRSAYRNTETSYVQTGLAIDAHAAENGAMRILPGSHRYGELAVDGAGPIMDQRLAENALSRAGLDPTQLIDLELEPGDLAFWSLYLLHGSRPNHSRRDRRFYLNGYVAADDCDRGEWSFRDGQPCHLGEPVLVHYEELESRPEPHFLEGS